MQYLKFSDLIDTIFRNINFLASTKILRQAATGQLFMILEGRHRLWHKTNTTTGFIQKCLFVVCFVVIYILIVFFSHQRLFTTVFRSLTNKHYWTWTFWAAIQFRNSSFYPFPRILSQRLSVLHCHPEKYFIYTTIPLNKMYFYLHLPMDASWLGQWWASTMDWLPIIFSPDLWRKRIPSAIPDRLGNIFLV